MYKQKTPLSPEDQAILQLLEGSCMYAAEVSDKTVAPIAPQAAPIQSDTVIVIGATAKISENDAESD